MYFYPGSQSLSLHVEFVVEISRCRAPLHRSTTQALRPAADVELYLKVQLYSALQRSRALYSSTALQRSTLYILYTLPQLNPVPDGVRLSPRA